MQWVEPITVDKLLDRVAKDWTEAPPESNGVYVISVKPWKGEPCTACDPLYVGSNTGNSFRFRTRMGDLVADMFGFYGTTTGHHSGGQSLNTFCREEGLSPRALYVGWARDCECARCTEIQLYERLYPRLNKKRPARCPNHG